MQEFRQFNETDPLQKVIIGRYQEYRTEAAYVELVNESQKRGLPQVSDLAPEFEQFRGVLEAAGVEVVQPDYVGPFVYDQLTPRDIGITIGHRFVVANMRPASRRYEVAGIFSHLLKVQGPEPLLLFPPPEAFLEGGDIVVDKKYIFVGLSQRTNEAGFQFIQDTFGDTFTVVPVRCRSLAEGEDVLHLDCTFVPVGERYALIYPEGLQSIPEALRDLYDWIPVHRQEQAALATNVLSIDPQHIISRDSPACTRVNAELQRRGIQVLPIPFDAAPATGGSFRCCSLPLYRG